MSFLSILFIWMEPTVQFELVLSLLMLLLGQEPRHSFEELCNLATNEFLF